jgi:hypothetical protein
MKTGARFAGFVVSRVVFGAPRVGMNTRPRSGSYSRKRRKKMRNEYHKTIVERLRFWNALMAGGYLALFATWLIDSLTS